MQRVAVIASADLSHKVNEQSPGGATPEGILFDTTVEEATRTNNVEKLMQLSPTVIEGVGQCGFRPIMTLLGTLQDMNVTPKTLCYEAPFGVGYLTTRYDIV
jgi:aromatic ring-opening dioxygenase LigB subunit